MGGAERSNDRRGCFYRGPSRRQESSTAPRLRLEHVIERHVNRCKRNRDAAKFTPLFRYHVVHGLDQFEQPQSPKTTVDKRLGSLYACQPQTVVATHPDKSNDPETGGGADVDALGSVQRRLSYPNREPDIAAVLFLGPQAKMEWFDEHRRHRYRPQLQAS